MKKLNNLQKLEVTSFITSQTALTGVQKIKGGNFARTATVGVPIFPGDTTDGGPSPSYACGLESQICVNSVYQSPTEM